MKRDDIYVGKKGVVAALQDKLNNFQLCLGQALPRFSPEFSVFTAQFNLRFYLFLFFLVFFLAITLFLLCVIVVVLNDIRSVNGIVSASDWT